MSGRWGEFGQCKGWSPTNGGRCFKPATGDDLLCNPHRAGAKKRAENDAKRKARWDAQTALYRVHRAQQRVVDAWRAAHPLDVFPEPWVCPLCNAHVQTAREDHMQRAVASHQEAHGDDWIAYTACSEALS